jgi:alkylation response protein AidB-like acyl-CoA dehydrogenase
MASQALNGLLAAIERISPLIAEHAATAETDRRLSGAVYQATYDVGLFGMLAPKAYGGFELHPAECIQAWEAISRKIPQRRGTW